MQAVELISQKQQHDNQQQNHSIDEDQQAEDLFNQIQIDQKLMIHQNNDQDLEDPFQSLIQKKKSIKKQKRNNILQLDSDNLSEIQNDANSNQVNLPGRKQKKASRKQKKLKKMRQKGLGKQKKHKKQKKKEKKLKKIKKEKNGSQNNNQQRQQWSGLSSQSQQSDSNASSDSLLQRLNPSKKKNGSNRKQYTEMKQGFSLKQLGNQAVVDHASQQNLSDDSQYKQMKRKKKTKTQKKDLPKNNQILKQLVNIGLCVQEENNQGSNRQGQVDNGLQQLYNMKNSKKKGVKIMNKLFVELQVNQQQADKQPLPKQIQLQVKQRVYTGPSQIASSFLAKTQKLKKIRGMESQIKNQEYQKMISIKAKQSMARLINQKQIEQADQIQLDVKVPQIVKGSGEINNSMFLKRISSQSHNQSQGSCLVKSSKQEQKQQNVVIQSKILKKGKETSTKLSRVDFFRSISEQLRARKCRQLTDQVIKNSFKVTQLQQIEQMRKKNEQRRRKQALVGSDDEEDSDYEQQIKQKQVNKSQDLAEVPSNLGFMNFKVQIKPLNDMNRGQSQDFQINKQMVNQGNEAQEVERKNIEGQIRKTTSFAIQINKSIPDEKLKKLLQMQQRGDEMQQQQQQRQQGQQQHSQEQNQQLNQILNGRQVNQVLPNEQQDEMNNDEELPAENNQEQEQQVQSENEFSQSQIQQAEKVDIEVELEVGESEISQVEDNQCENISEKQELNEEYQIYLNELEAEGINIKKNRFPNKQVKLSHQARNHEKQNVMLIENRQSQNHKDVAQQENQARKQFRKLRKLATVLKIKRQKQIKIRKAGQFFQEQAEQGSDDEAHDNQVKKINYDQEAKQYQGIDLDAQLQQLIDNVVDVDQQNQALAFQKYLQDVKVQDRQILKRIMKGDFKRRSDGENMIDELDQDQKRRQQRMQQFDQYLKQKQMEEGKQLYMKDQSQNQQNSEDDDSNSSNIDKDSKKNKQKKIIEPTQQQFEEVDEMNEQNLKRYLDDANPQNYRTTIRVKKNNIKQVHLPQSYQRSKQTQMRNTMKVKNPQLEGPIKLKKTSSHLNQLIMKTKEKMKPLVFNKNFSLFNKK